MKMKTAFILFIAAFVCLCGFYVMDSGVFVSPQSGGEFNGVTLAEAVSVPKMAAAEELLDKGDLSFLYFTAINSGNKTITLGSNESPKESDNQFKFQLELSSLGASIASATLSEYNDRDPKDPKPLEILSTATKTSSGVISSLACSKIIIGDSLYYLSSLEWKARDKVKNYDGSESVTFEAVVLKKFGAKAAGAEPVYKDTIKISKTFTVVPNSYDIKLSIDVENLDDTSYTSSLVLQGPAGMGREGTRSDMRAIVAGYVNPNGYVESVKRQQVKLRKAKQKKDSEGLSLAMDSADMNFIWASVTNKYFAAIVRPMPSEGADFTKDVKLGSAEYFDPGISDNKPDGDEDVSFSMSTASVELAAAGQEGSSQSVDFEIFVGPKKKDMFQENEVYNKLGYIQTLSFMPCFCCPESIINPISFAIMAIMKGMYAVVHNYGVVIIILVLLIRLALHPITKKSQVSMMKMQKISSHPRMVEIKQKYGNDRQELHKHTMEFYREHNVSPASGMVSMLPMMLQMPIWIALYRAIYANIELRGAGFLPVWITDLSSPDALIPFTNAIVVPFVGWHIEAFNLLPILLGVAMFLQQKLMPHQASQTADPQMAQQQKMMMFMMPVMMLIFLYPAPSGLNLYIMASTFAGVFEQKIIRKHIKEKEEMEAMGKVSVTKKTGGKAKKKKSKPFFKN